MGKQKLSKDQKRRIARSLLGDTDQHSIKWKAKALALKYGYEFSAVWQWVMHESEKLPENQLTLAQVQAAIMVPEAWKKLIKRVTTNDFSYLNTQLNDHLFWVSLSPSDFQFLWKRMEADTANELRLGHLIFHTDFPVSILQEAIHDPRWQSDIAHRIGPEELLLAVAEVYQGEEPVYSLLRFYYLTEAYPISKLIEFVKKWKGKLRQDFISSMGNWEEVSRDRIALTRSLLV